MTLLDRAAGFLVRHAAATLRRAHVPYALVVEARDEDGAPNVALATNVAPDALAAMLGSVLHELAPGAGPR